MISPEQAPPGLTYLPESAPWPFTATDCPGARVVRSENGAISLQRRRCATHDEWWGSDRWRGAVLVAADGHSSSSALDPPHQSPYRWDGDSLRWAAALSRQWSSGAGHTVQTRSEPVVSVELATPRTNVLSIEDLP